MDPSWHQVDLKDRQEVISAFSTELLTQIGHVEDLALVKVTVSWDDLIQGLKNREYEAILSPMTPYLFNAKEFRFSSVYLPLGPVLVVPAHSAIRSMDHLSGKQIAIIGDPSDDLFLRQIPGVWVRYYPSDAAALNALMQGVIDGALIDVITATAYCNDLYQGDIEIVSSPLTDEGLRLIALYDTADDLIQQFDRGLRTLRNNGFYEQLLHKWSLRLHAPLEGSGL